MSSRVIALVSGGLDSFLLVHRLLRRGAQVVPVYIRGGLIWESAELAWLKRWLAQLRPSRLEPRTVLHIPLRTLYGSHWSLTGRGVPSSESPDAAVYLPGRNVLLLGAAAVFAAQQGASTLAMGTLAGNPFGDATPAFFRRFSVCLSEALARPMRITTPLQRFTKSRLVASAASEPFELTFSCLRPRGLRHCGQCNKCAERRRAFRTARVPDPTTYAD